MLGVALPLQQHCWRKRKLKAREPKWSPSKGTVPLDFLGWNLKLLAGKDIYSSGPESNISVRFKSALVGEALCRFVG